MLLVYDNEFLTDTSVRIARSRLGTLPARGAVTIGTTLRVGHYNGRCGEARITGCTATTVDLAVTLSESPPPKRRLTLILALPRPKFLARIVRAVTGLGVPDVYLIPSWRVDKSYWKSPRLQRHKLDDYIRDGLQQAGDTIPPAIHVRRLFRPFVEDEAALLCREATALVAAPDGPAEGPAVLPQPCVLAIGPERGFTPFERELFCSNGFSCVRFSRRILTVEQAAIALCARAP
jgi:RsmE family RNA methyltransferase